MSLPVYVSLLLLSAFRGSRAEWAEQKQYRARKSLCARLGECCRQVEAEEVSKSSNKFTKPRTNTFLGSVSYTHPMQVLSLQSEHSLEAPGRPSPDRHLIPNGRRSA